MVLIDRERCTCDYSDQVLSFYNKGRKQLVLVRLHTIDKIVKKLLVLSLKKCTSLPSCTVRICRNLSSVQVLLSIGFMVHIYCDRDATVHFQLYSSINTKIRRFEIAMRRKNTRRSCEANTHKPNAQFVTWRYVTRVSNLML